MVAVIQSQEHRRTHPYPLRAVEKARILAMRVVNSFLNVYVLLLYLIRCYLCLFKLIIVSYPGSCGVVLVVV